MEGQWHALAKLPAGADYPVVDSSAVIDQIRSVLDNYTSLPQQEIPQTGDINSNPFAQIQPVTVVPTPTPLPTPSLTPVIPPEQVQPESP